MEVHNNSRATQSCNSSKQQLSTFRTHKHAIFRAPYTIAKAAYINGDITIVYCRIEVQKALISKWVNLYYKSSWQRLYDPVKKKAMVLIKHSWQLRVVEGKIVMGGTSANVSFRTKRDSSTVWKECNPTPEYIYLLFAA